MIMIRRPRFFFWLALALLAGLAARPVAADGRVVSPAGVFDTLAEALAQAQDGDTLEVYSGLYSGPLVVERSVTLIGHDWPVIDGGGRGTVLKLLAPDVTLRGFVIRNSGDSLDQENSGIAVEAPGAVLESNRLEETLFGIYLREAPGGVVRGNVIASKVLPVPRRGDAIRVWYSNDTVIEGNLIRRGRDVVLWYSERLTVMDNQVFEGRYGLHFMYCDDAQIEGNLLVDNSVGTFLMYSRRLHLKNNTIAGNRGPSGYGAGLKDMDDAVIEGNLFLDNRIGAYLDNSPREVDSIGRLTGNVFAFNDVGVSLMPSVRHNEISGNSFVDNGEQVHIAGGGGQAQDNLWTVGEMGNFWNDYVGYDADRDGYGDVPYQAERLFESLIDQYSSLRLFVYSPVEQAIDFAARAVPFVRPQPKLTDDRPLMAPMVPTGVPAVPRAGSGPLGAASLLLLGLAAVVLAASSRAGQARSLPKLKAASTEMRRAKEDQGEGSMIQVKNLQKRFGSLAAVDGLSFEVAHGEAVALWGANGAGKTTALRCLLGLIPFQGEIRLGGYNAAYQDKAARRLLGFVPQEINFHDDMSVRETLAFYARLKKTEAAGPYLDELLERLGLSGYGRQQVGDLSGGTKQRLALAIALLADPPVLVLDEPTASLDIRARSDFLALLSEVKAAGKTLIFSSHRLEEVMALADRVVVLEEGKLVAECPPVELGRYLKSETTLKLHLSGEEWLSPAVAMLRDNGFAAQRNGTGVWVQVVPQEKARPILLLAAAGIPVDDFQIE